jgi:leader peptidase (prepilin peptidase)/N-methyltransferase
MTSTPLVPSGLTVSVLLAAAGVVAGGAARLLLRRLRRGARVPPPWCEVGVAVAWGATGAAAGAGALPPRWMPVLLALGWVGVAVGAVDVCHRRLPDALTLPALPLVLLLLVPLGPAAVLRGAAGAAVAFAAHALVHLAAPRALGAGDVKLAAPLGAVLAAASWSALAQAGVLAALLSGASAVAVLVVPWSRGDGLRSRWRAALPHGPPMALAAWLVTLVSSLGPAAAGARGP